MKATRSALALCACLLALSCDSAREADAKRRDPVALDDQEDAVCGMVVREQSAPRGQVVHRDGTRAFFCSVGDMLIYTNTPSPHGRITQHFVEILSPDEAPEEAHVQAHAWVDAEGAYYVVGVERPGIMGPPVLSYATEAEARRVAEAHPEGRVLDFAGLHAWWREQIAD